MTQDEIIRIIEELEIRSIGRVDRTEGAHQYYWRGIRDACIEIMGKIERGEIPDDK